MAVFKGHIVAAGCKELGIDKPTAKHSTLPMVPSTEDERQTFVYGLARRVVDKVTIVEESLLGSSVHSSKDHVYNYARQLCHFSSLVMEFTDAWSEGDGERIIRGWKFFLPHFFANGRTKYALQALRLQLQLMTLQPTLVHQLTWGRFVNTQGGKGHNLPCDLHNEHVNRVFKEVVANMGSNFTQSSSTRVARCITSLNIISQKFDDQCSVPKESSRHTTKGDGDDVHKVAAVVLENDILTEYSERKGHSNFPKISIDPLAFLDRGKLEQWIKKKFEQRLKDRAMSDGFLLINTEYCDYSSDSEDEEEDIQID